MNAFIDNNNQLPTPNDPASLRGEQKRPDQFESEATTESLSQELQSIFEGASSPFELTRQFHKLKARGSSIKSNISNE